MRDKGETRQRKCKIPGGEGGGGGGGGEGGEGGGDYNLKKEKHWVFV